MFMLIPNLKEAKIRTKENAPETFHSLPESMPQRDLITGKKTLSILQLLYYKKAFRLFFYSERNE